MQTAQVHLHTPFRVMLLKTRPGPSVRRIEKRNGKLWLQCTKCGYMKPEKKFQRELRSLTNRASICRECGKKATLKRENDNRERRKLSAVV
jgi:NAD-dependent SIR2 family protein deacetylase